MQQPHKSPFYVIQEFIPPMLCEDIVDDLNLLTPDTDKDDNPIKSVKFNEYGQGAIFERLEPMIPQVEQYFGFEYAGTEQMAFEWLPEGCAGIDPHCENSMFLRKKWVKTRNRDITGIIFFHDYQQKTPFDTDYEVYGGKLEFIQHKFGFNPERGTLILFPSGPHFVNNSVGIKVGDLVQARIHLAAKTPYLYNPKNFPGDYRTWFQHLA